MSDRVLDRITLTGLTAVGHHGVFEHEKRDGQPFVVDVVLEADLRAAGRSDDLGDTVNYALVADAVVAVVTGEALDLIEAVAARIADAVLGVSERVESATVTVHKPQAPIPHDFADVAVTVVRSRS